MLITVIPVYHTLLPIIRATIENVDNAPGPKSLPTLPMDQILLFTKMVELLYQSNSTFEVTRLAARYGFLKDSPITALLRHSEVVGPFKDLLMVDPAWGQCFALWNDLAKFKFFFVGNLFLRFISYTNIYSPIVGC